MAGVVRSLNKLGASFQQTMLRIKDPMKTVEFYENNFGFKLIHVYKFPEWKFDLYFMGTFLEDDQAQKLTPGTVESEKYLWTTSNTVLEFTHNYGTETDDNYKVNNGNVEPYRGFGHIALMTPDVYAACADLEAAGVKFQKKPDDGKMKGLAFALDPDGYWVEIIRRGEDAPFKNKFNLAQTMFRVKDAQKSLVFYRDLLGMSVLEEKHFPEWKFSLYFLAHLEHDAETNMKKRFGPVIELTHNHGTESDPAFSYHNGNDEDVAAGKLRGFGHVGFLVDDLDATCALLEANGVSFKKKPQEGAMRGLAFAYDPDKYWVELIQRGGLSMIKPSE